MDYNKLASKESIEITTRNLKSKGYEVFAANNGEEALAIIKKIIPSKSSVMNGTSTTLQQIGYNDYLKLGNHSWVDLHSKINDENNKEERNELRRQSVLSDYYLGSVHALAETGEFIIASNSGSQLPHVTYTSPNLIFVVSTKKIVPTLAEAMLRLEKHVYPLEDQRMMNTYQAHSGINKLLIFKGEAESTGRKVTIILIQENLGF